MVSGNKSGLAPCFAQYHGGGQRDIEGTPPGAASGWCDDIDLKHRYQVIEI